MYTKYDNFVSICMYHVQILYSKSFVCTYFVYMMHVQNVHASLLSCIQNVQKYVQNTYKLDGMVAVFLLAKPPPSTTHNGMFLSYNHHYRYLKYLFQSTTCILNIFANIQNVYKI